MTSYRHNIKLPAASTHELRQDEAWFQLIEDGKTVRLRFHDYAQIFDRPGLYEQLFYERLKCDSPRKVNQVLAKVLTDNRVEITELRVLDLGAGNGMFGEELQKTGVARVVGIDISEQARRACERDRPGVYDAYHVTDISRLNAAMREDLGAWRINCLSCVAALGFGDIPARAFANAWNLVAPSGWIAFTIRDSFLRESDNTGFSRLIKSLLVTDVLEIHHLERYCHRISIDGSPLFYYTLVGRKDADIPAHIMAALEAD